MADIHVADTGTVFTVTVTDAAGAIIDLSAALTLEILFRPLNGLTFTRQAALVTDGSDGQIYYVTQAGDLLEAGEWELQAYVVLPGGAWHSDVTRFDVLANL